MTEVSVFTFCLPFFAFIALARMKAPMGYLLVLALSVICFFALGDKFRQPDTMNPLVQYLYPAIVGLIAGVLVHFLDRQYARN